LTNQTLPNTTVWGGKRARKPASGIRERNPAKSVERLIQARKDLDPRVVHKPGLVPKFRGAQWRWADNVPMLANAHTSTKSKYAPVPSNQSLAVHIGAVSCNQ